MVNQLGKKYNKLTIVKDSGERTRDRKIKWLCQCECGVLTKVDTCKLRNGHTKSCGCLHKEAIGKRQYKHGQSNRNKSRAYSSWNNMKQRCLNPKNKRYNHYGGRGIELCNEWYIFEYFFKDMGERPEGTSIDRINPDGNYEKSNCRWATAVEQNNNKRGR